MDLLEGEDLAARLERSGRLDPEATCRIVAEVARGLTRAHRAGIVHRDLKPANVFLSREEDGDVAKILDFGIAKSDADCDRESDVGLLFGTPDYMSPEQARGSAAIDHRSDLWSLGVIAFQCLTGRLPFEQQGIAELLTQIAFDPLPVPSQLGLGVPPGFDGWFARAASRDVEARFQSARELSDALETALGLDLPGSEIEASEPRASECATWGHAASPAISPLFSSPFHSTPPSRISRAAVAGVAAFMVILTSRGTLTYGAARGAAAGTGQSPRPSSMQSALPSSSDVAALDVAAVPAVAPVPLVSRTAVRGHVDASSTPRAKIRASVRRQNEPVPPIASVDFGI
jgi:serine/threonine protein kinase